MAQSSSHLPPPLSFLQHRNPKMECCMCGDVGFPDKLFQCVVCVHRFQHSYCGNYYDELVCDWCRSEGRISESGRQKKAAKENNRRSEYLAGESVKEGVKVKVINGRGGGSGSSSGSASAPSSAGKHSGRRYKLLKDVMC